MKLYVASSWKNPLYESTCDMLKLAGHEIMDWREGGGFGWHQTCGSSESNIVLQGGEFYRDKVLRDPVAKKGFRNDWFKMKDAHACVLLLPCGRSAHLEAGWFVGNLKPLHIYIPVFDTPELMYKMASSINFTIEELIAKIGPP